MIYIGKWCAGGWSSVFKCCGSGCQSCCTNFWECQCWPNYSKLPFSTWSIIYTLMMGIPAVVIFIYMLSETDHDDYCEHNYSVANGIAFVNYILTITFVIYAVWKIGEGYYKAFEKLQNPPIVKEVGTFLWHDILILFFIPFVIWTFVWDIVMLVWTNDENAYCDEEYDGLLTATEFMAGWHITMLFVGMLFFIIALCLLSCSENSCAKPLVSCIVCGFDNIEKEKRRRRQKALDEQNKQSNQHAEPQNQNSNNPAAPNQYNQPPHQNQYIQPPQGGYIQPPPAPQNNNAYPTPMPPHQQKYQTNNQEHQNQPYDPNGPPIANNNPSQQKSYMDRAKDGISKIMK